jgi:hypothetical protein
MRHGYRHPQGDLDYEEPEKWDEDEHPTTCICPDCAEWHWYLSLSERIDPLDDENWEPPY